VAASPRGKGVSGQAAAHRQGGRRCAPTSLGLLDFVARRKTHCAPRRALRSNSCDESEHEARKRAATKSSKPRRLATMRRGLPGHAFAADMVGARRLHAHHVSSLCDADPRPSLAAESARSADRHSMSPCRVPPAATRGCTEGNRLLAAPTWIPGQARDDSPLASMCPRRVPSAATRG
jgi:hypothetical protein